MKNGNRAESRYYLGSPDYFVSNMIGLVSLWSVKMVDAEGEISSSWYSRISKNNFSNTLFCYVMAGLPGKKRN